MQARIDNTISRRPAGKAASRRFFAKTASRTVQAAAILFALHTAGTAVAQPLPISGSPAIDAARSAQFAATRAVPAAKTLVAAMHPISGPVALAEPLDLSGPKFALSGHIAPIVASSTLTGTVDGSKSMQITFYLKPNNKAEMDRLAHDLYDPTSPMFHHFLTPQQRIALFSPTVDQFDRVAAYAQSGGLSIVDSSTDRQSITAVGSAQQIQTLFGVKLNTYRKPDGNQFFAPSTEPSLPGSIIPLVQYIRGLSDSASLHTANVTLPVGRSTAPASAKYQNAADGTVSAAFPNGLPSWEIQYAYGTDLYDTNGAIDGRNQLVSLVEFANWDNDVYTYVTNNNNTWPSYPINYFGLTTILVNGYTGYTTGNEDECNEDIEMLEAESPGLRGLAVYEEGTGDMNAVLEQVLSDDDTNVLSSSYVEYEADMAGGSETTYDQLTEELALEGIAMFVASGDQGSYPNGTNLAVNGWAASPWVTAVGGTSLSINDSNAAYNGETVWNDAYGASGGGVGLVPAIPDYQSGYLSMFPGQDTEANTFKRNIPDVSLNADPEAPYNVYIQGGPALGGGTSLATPLWAGFWANADQYREDYSEGPLGFANPTLYTLAEGPDYNADFHDITSGSNTDVAFSSLYNAGTGYDNATGLGSINGYQLMTDLYFQAAGSPIESVTGPATAQSGQSISMRVMLQDVIPYNGATVPNQVDLYSRPEGSSNWTQIGTGKFIIGNYGYGNYTYVGATMPDVPVATAYEFAASVSINGSPQSAISPSFAIVTISPNTISSLTLASEDVAPGQTDQATITLAQPAAQNELIDLSSSVMPATVPATVTIPVGQQSVGVEVTAGKVSSTTGFKITATADATSGLATGTSASVKGRVVPNVAESVHSLTITPKSVMEGKGTGGIVTLTVPAPAGGQVVTLQNSDSADATVPASVTVPAGGISAMFHIAALQGALATTVTVTADVSGTTPKSATFAITDPVIAVDKVVLSTTGIVGGKTLTAKVVLNAPALDGGDVVTLASSNTAAATVPVTVTVLAGKMSAEFTVTTLKVSGATPVTISASDAHGLAMSTLTVRA